MWINRMESGVYYSLSNTTHLNRIAVASVCMCQIYDVIRLQIVGSFVDRFRYKLENCHFIDWCNKKIIQCKTSGNITLTRFWISILLLIQWCKCLLLWHCKLFIVLVFLWCIYVNACRQYTAFLIENFLFFTIQLTMQLQLKFKIWNAIYFVFIHDTTPNFYTLFK